MPQVLEALGRALVYVVLGLAMALPTTTTHLAEPTHAGYLYAIGQQVADMGDVINAPGVEDYGWMLVDVGVVVADLHIPQDLNGDGVLAGDLELGS